MGPKAPRGDHKGAQPPYQAEAHAYMDGSRAAATVSLSRKNPFTNGRNVFRPHFGSHVPKTSVDTCQQFYEVEGLLSK